MYPGRLFAHVKTTLGLQQLTLILGRPLETVEPFFVVLFACRCIQQHVFVLELVLYVRECLLDREFRRNLVIVAAAVCRNLQQDLLGIFAARRRRRNIATPPPATWIAAAGVSSTTRIPTPSRITTAARISATLAIAWLLIGVVVVLVLQLLGREANGIDDGVSALRSLDGTEYGFLAPTIDAIREHYDRFASGLFFQHLIRGQEESVEKDISVDIFVIRRVRAGRYARRSGALRLDSKLPKRFLDLVPRIGER